MKNTRDKLTGLYNREWIEHYIGKKLKKGIQISIAILDLDFFTNLNQKIGYMNGDQTLRKIAATLLIEKDIVTARYGSDEFIIVFVDKSKEYVLEYVKKLKELFKTTRFVSVIPYEKVRISFSMGVSYSSANLKGSFLLLKSAEIALFKAKKSGRNRIVSAGDKKIRILKYRGKCTTIIGRSLKGSCIDRENAFFASIAEPYGVEIDRNKDLLFVDRSNHQIKRVKGNKIYTIAGCGTSGYQGDGKQAQEANLCKPSGVCVHKSGRIYIADTGNHCIRMIEDGIISTIAGTGECGYSGDGDKADSARLNRPGGIAVDDNENLYTNDYGNNVIRRIDHNGIITTIAGTGEYGYSGDWSYAHSATINMPYGLCVDAGGNELYIVDYGNHCIRLVNLTTGIITTFCGTGEAGYSGDGHQSNDAMINGPFWVCLYNQNLFIADANNHCIRKVDLQTKIITTIIGNGVAGYVDANSDSNKVRLNLPAGIVASNDYLYIADYGNNAIRKAVLE